MNNENGARRPWETPTISYAGNLVEVVQSGSGGAGGKTIPLPYDPGIYDKKPRGQEH